MCRGIANRAAVTNTSTSTCTIRSAGSNTGTLVHFRPVKRHSWHASRVGRLRGPTHSRTRRAWVSPRWNATTTTPTTPPAAV